MASHLPTEGRDTASISLRWSIIKPIPNYEDRYRLFIERSAAGAFRSTVNGNLLYCNEAFVRTFGYASREEVLAHSAENFYWDPVHRRVFLKRLLAERTLTNWEWRGRRKDGSPLWILGNASLVEGEEGQDQVIEGTCIDITERKQAEHRLEERTVFLQALLENSPLGIAAFDSEDRVTMVNAAFERLFLYTAQEVIGRPLEELIKTPAMAAETADFIRRINRGETVHAFTHRRRKDGALLNMEVYGVPLLISGKVVGAVGIYQDLTERNRLEEEFRQAQKMEAVGRLAGGGAHDFNNLLTGILGYGELVLEQLSANEPMRDLTQ